MSEKNRNAASENMDTSQTIDRRTYLKLAGMTGSGIGAGIGTGALGTQFTAPARAASVIEDFNYSSSSEMRDHYHFDMGESNASLESVSSTATSDASDSVLEISGGNAKMLAYDDNDGSDLTAYPQVGETITCWIRGANATENMNVIYGAEDGDGRDDHYYVKVDMDKSTMGIGVVDDGNATWLQSAPEDPSFSTNAWYKLEIQWNDASPNTHDVTLFDQSGNSVASLSYDGSDSADPHHEGRGFGYSAYLGSSNEAAYYDYSKTSDGSDDGSPDLSKWENNAEHSIVEDFELTDIQEDYTFDRGNPEGATLVRDSDYTGSNPLGPTYSGQKALRISDYNVEMTRQPSDGLNNYPSPGTTSSCWVMASGGADRLNLSYGVTDPQNRYFVRVNFEKDRLVLYKYKNNDSTWLDSDSAGSTLSLRTNGTGSKLTGALTEHTTSNYTTEMITC